MNYIWRCSSKRRKWGSSSFKRKSRIGLRLSPLQLLTIQYSPKQATPSIMIKSIICKRSSRSWELAIVSLRGKIWRWRRRFKNHKVFKDKRRSSKRSYSMSVNPKTQRYKCSWFLFTTWGPKIFESTSC